MEFVLEREEIDVIEDLPEDPILLAPRVIDVDEEAGAIDAAACFPPVAIDAAPSFPPVAIDDAVCFPPVAIVDNAGELLDGATGCVDDTKR